MIRYCNPVGQVRMVPLGSQGQGPIGTLGRRFWQGLTDAIPDLTNEITLIFADLDGHVCAEVVMRGTRQRDFDNIQDLASRYLVDYSFVFDVGSDGLIQKVDCYWDNSNLH